MWQKGENNMSENKPAKKTGRKKVVWTDEQYQLFERACCAHLSVRNIEKLFMLGHKTINRLCKERYKDPTGKPIGLVEIREMLQSEKLLWLSENQFKLSETNPTMAIFLGKQYLGQKDNPGEESNLSGNITFNLVKASSDPNVINNE